MATEISQNNPKNRLTTTGFVVGIVAFFICWFPGLGLLAGIVATILNGIALRTSVNKRKSLIGLIAGSIATLVGLTIAVGLTLLAINGSPSTHTNSNNSSQNQIASEKKDFTKGEKALFRNYEVKVNSLTRQFSPSTTQATEGQEYILVNISVTNPHNEPIHVTSYGFTIDEAGTVKGQRINFETPDKFNGGQIAPGKTITGNLAFEVTSGATDLKLRHATKITAGPDAGQTATYTLAFN